MSPAPQRMKVLLSEAGLHPGVWSGHRMEKRAEDNDSWAGFSAKNRR